MNQPDAGMIIAVMLQLVCSVFTLLYLMIRPDIHHHDKHKEEHL